MYLFNKLTTFLSLFLIAFSFNSNSAEDLSISKQIVLQKKIKKCSKSTVRLTTIQGTHEDLARLKHTITQIRNSDFSQARKTLEPLVKDQFADAYYYMFISYMPWLILSPDLPQPFDWENGIPWLKKAADSGHAKAQMLFSQWNLEGHAGKMRPSYEIINVHNIYTYAKKSAEQGYKPGQRWLKYILSVLAERLIDKGFKQNYSEINNEINMWLILAFSTDQKLSGKLVPADPPEKRDIALKMAVEWQKNHPEAYQQCHLSSLDP